MYIFILLLMMKYTSNSRRHTTNADVRQIAKLLHSLRRQNFAKANKNSFFFQKKKLFFIFSF